MVSDESQDAAAFARGRRRFSATRRRVVGHLSAVRSEGDVERHAERRPELGIYGDANEGATAEGFPVCDRAEVTEVTEGTVSHRETERTEGSKIFNR